MKPGNAIIFVIWGPIIVAVIGGLIGFFIARYFGFSSADSAGIGEIWAILLCSSFVCFYIRDGAIEGLLTEKK